MHQNSKEWLAARVGFVTASQMYRCMASAKRTIRWKPDKNPAGKGWVLVCQRTGEIFDEVFQLKKDAEEKGKTLDPPTPTFGDMALSYMDEIIAELDSGSHFQTGQTKAMEWGNDFEEEARQKAFVHLRKHFGEREVYEPQGANAFITNPDLPGLGCSPDFIVGDDALGEIKCPFNPARHVTAALDIESWFRKEHHWQIQGSLLVTGRTKYYVVSYDPRSVARPLVVGEIKADPHAQQALKKRLLEFQETLSIRLAAFRGQIF